MKPLLLLMVCFFVAFLSGCREEASRTIEQIISSPDKKVDAVLATYHGNATVPNTIDVYIVKHGEEITEADRVFSFSKYDNYKVSWLKNKSLVFVYGKARIAGFSNEWRSAQVDNLSYLVEIELRKSAIP